MNKLILLAAISVALSGCVMAQPQHQSHKLQVKEVTHSEGEEVEQVAASGVLDRLHSVTLRGNDNGYFTVVIGNGYTRALVRDEPAKIIRKNENYYEITNKDYIIGVYLDEKSFNSASWNRHKGRDHGDFVLITH